MFVLYNNVVIKVIQYADVVFMVHLLKSFQKK